MFLRIVWSLEWNGPIQSNKMIHSRLFLQIPQPIYTGKKKNRKEKNREREILAAYYIVFNPENVFCVCVCAWVDSLKYFVFSVHLGVLLKYDF